MRRERSEHQYPSSRSQCPSKLAAYPACDAVDGLGRSSTGARLSELRRPIIVLRAKSNVAAELSDLRYLRPPVYDVDGMKAFRTRELQNQPAHRRACGSLRQPFF